MRRRDELTNSPNALTLAEVGRYPTGALATAFALTGCTYLNPAFGDKPDPAGAEGTAARDMLPVDATTGGITSPDDPSLQTSTTNLSDFGDASGTESDERSGTDAGLPGSTGSGAAGLEGSSGQPPICVTTNASPPVRDTFLVTETSRPELAAASFGGAPRSFVFDEGGTGLYLMAVDAPANVSWAHLEVVVQTAGVLQTGAELRAVWVDVPCDWRAGEQEYEDEQAPIGVATWNDCAAEQTPWPGSEGVLAQRVSDEGIAPLRGVEAFELVRVTLDVPPPDVVTPDLSIVVYSQGVRRNDGFQVEALEGGTPPLASLELCESRGSSQQ